MNLRSIVVATIAALALTAPAYAGEKHLLLGIATANALDVVSTKLVLSRGVGVEANPLMTGAKLVPMKALGTAGELLAVHALWSHGHKRTAVIAGIALITANGIIARHNFNVARGRR